MFFPLFLTKSNKSQCKHSPNVTYCNCTVKTPLIFFSYSCMIKIQIFKKITTYFFIAIPGVPCPAKNQDLYGNDIHSQVVGTWDKCGEYIEESNFSRDCKSYVKQIHGQLTSLF